MWLLGKLRFTKDKFYSGAKALTLLYHTIHSKLCCVLFMCLSDLYVSTQPVAYTSPDTHAVPACCLHCLGRAVLPANAGT